MAFSDAYMMICVCFYIHVFDESSLGGFPVGVLTCMVEHLKLKQKHCLAFPYPSEWLQISCIYFHMIES